MQDINNLFPVFLKLEKLNVLIVGGGNVALEKLTAILQNSPAVIIRLVSTVIIKEIKIIAEERCNISLIENRYASHFLKEADIVIVAVNNQKVSEQVRNDARKHKILINVADNPSLCDFYLGSIVKKGNLKIAISTNGKSPTIAKRLKEVINELLPDEMENILDNMQSIRQRLSGDFKEKVKKLNELTNVLVSGKTK